MNNKKKILLISHNASRSGAPILLLNLSSLLQEMLGYTTDFLLKNGGVLEQDFLQLGKVIFLREPAKVKNRLTSFFKKKENKLLKINYNQYDFIIANTILNGDILPQIRSRYKGLIISYIHELAIATDFVTNAETLKSMINNSDLFFCPCLAVKNFLTDSCHIDKNKIIVLPYYIPQNEEPVRIAAQKSHFIVGGSGTVELRKGTDIFIRLAKSFSEKFTGLPVKFIWKGAGENSLEYKFLMADVKRLNLESHFLFLPADNDMSDFYSQVDVFVLTSREDPYPLVVLEAARARIPSICFKDSGGAEEFIQNNGKIIDYMNIDDMINAIYEYYNNPEMRLNDGQKSLVKLKALHQNKELIANKIQVILNSLTAI